jgi:two-component system chemotaxis response regulator CheB
MNANRKIRLLVVDDSALIRKMIPQALKREHDIEVVGTAVDPYNARDLILQLKPDILTLDIEMPRMDGLTFLKILMEKHPMPVIILSSLTQRGSMQAMEALKLGAVDVLAKPEGSFSLGETGQVLGDRIRGAIAAKVNRAGGPRRGVTGQPGKSLPDSARRPTQWHPHQLCLLGASTGGTEAIRRVISRLPAHFPGICIVQHIPAFISNAFAERVNQDSQMEVREARDGDAVHAGRVLIAPGDFHMVLEREGGQYRVRLRKGAKVWYQRPAVDVLFRSAAPLVGSLGLGVLLTGMGRDGAEGLLQLQQAGAATIAQDEATSVVYGMPKAAADLGAADQVLPISDIPAHMMQRFMDQLKS